MARPGKAQASEDLWHLSIDDLFASPAEAATGPVTGPFVINLSLSTAPSGAMPRGMPRFERLCVYQLKRKAGGREEFRLRLGIIKTELEADAILAAVREHYPAARKESASEEDATAVKARAARAAMRLEQAKKAQARMQQATAAVATRHAERSPKAKAAPSTSPMPSAPPSTPQTWNVDEVLPQFAGHAPVKCEPATRTAVAKPESSKAIAPTPAAASPQTPTARKSTQPRTRPAKRTQPPPTAARAPHPEPKQTTAIELAPPPAPVPAPPESAVIKTPTEIVEITLSAPMPAPSPIPVPAPAPVVAASPPAPAHDLDSDPNAVTAEVEAPTFMIDAPAREPVVAEMELTIEAQHLPSVAFEAPRVDTLTMEAPHITSMTALREDTVTTEASYLEGSITIEAPHITLAETPDPISAVEAAVAVEPPHITTRETAESAPAAAAAVVAAEAPPERAFVDTITMEVPALQAAPARSPEDSGSLERLVARIDSMVEELPAPKPIAMQASAPLSIDSTQTQRALTPLKLPDDEGSTNFVVQLILSESEIDPDQVPSLDIFSEYRLYRIMGLDDEQVMHALRLGFFSSEAGAQAVAGYLAIFFDSPSVARVSDAERERFAQDRVAARKDVGATGVHSVIELTSPAPLPERRAREAVPKTGSAASPKSGSLWSRLVSPLKR